MHREARTHEDRSEVVGDQRFAIHVDKRGKLVGFRRVLDRCPRRATAVAQDERLFARLCRKRKQTLAALVGLELAPRKPNARSAKAHPVFVDHMQHVSRGTQSLDKFQATFFDEHTARHASPRKLDDVGSRFNEVVKIDRALEGIHARARLEESDQELPNERCVVPERLQAGFERSAGAGVAACAPPLVAQRCVHVRRGWCHSQVLKEQFRGGRSAPLCEEQAMVQHLGA